MRAIDRHRVILDLIDGRNIGRQEELVRLLTDRGFSVTQASVSRDLERLGVVKLNGRYVRQATGGPNGTFGRITFKEAGDNLIVVRCGSGMASAAAVRIDGGEIPEIVGTIAGDDTIFVAVKGPTEMSRAIRALSKILRTSEGNGENKS